MMRAIERTAKRAGLPLSYSQGFNPRPRLSLVCPRPVGVATRDDLLVVSLEAGQLDRQELERRLNIAAPDGLRFLRSEPLQTSRTPLPRTARYELALEDAAVRRLQERLDRLTVADRWTVQRQVFGDRRGGAQSREIDLRPLVGDVCVSEGRLRATLVRQGDLWARPGEVLILLGLDGRRDLACVIRTQVEYEM